MIYGLNGMIVVRPEFSVASHLAPDLETIQQATITCDLILFI